MALDLRDTVASCQRKTESQDPPIVSMILVSPEEVPVTAIFGNFDPTVAQYLGQELFQPLSDGPTSPFYIWRLQQQTSEA